MKQSKLDEMYMRMAVLVSEYSYAVRKKVGSILVTESGMISPGFNGTLSGWPNVCELDDGTTDSRITLHAEQNSFFKMLKEGVSSRGATLYVTMLPCSMECAKMVVASGIKRVVYLEEYRDDFAIPLFVQSGVVIDKYMKEL